MGRDCRGRGRGSQDHTGTSHLSNDGASSSVAVEDVEGNVDEERETQQGRRRSDKWDCRACSDCRRQNDDCRGRNCRGRGRGSN